jgi:pimeloyl-ACP methyl ester carboxylesterase
MKAFSILFIALIASFNLKSQDITGQWNGQLKVQGMQLRLQFHIVKTETGYSSTMDSPDQAAMGIPATNTSFKDSMITIEIAAAQIEYSGKWTGDEIVGTFKQGGLRIPLNLSRKPVEKETLNRPQTPEKPYPYYTEEVTFENKKANITLAGTLSLPKKEGNFPGAILISGSGPQNRDEEIFEHKPFLVIADHLTKNGIAVLRYDDRGVGQSGGNFSTATSADFATDVESAVAFLKERKEIDKNKIGLIGHSEGGIIAPMVASKSKDIAWIVLLAGTGIRGDKLLLLQQELIAKASGMPAEEINKSLEINKEVFNKIIQSKNEDSLKKHLSKYLKEALKSDTNAAPKGMPQDEFINTQVKQITSPWMLYFIKYDPAPTLQKVKCPVFALNGEKDLQVPPKINLDAIKTALERGGNEKVTVKELPGLNHLFQQSKTGLPAEYATIEETISPKALEEITGWILHQVNLNF